MQITKVPPQQIAIDLNCTIEQYESSKQAFFDFTTKVENGGSTNTLEIIRFVQEVDVPESCRLFLMHKITAWATRESLGIGLEDVVLGALLNAYK
jgi:hypothetical protein